MNHHFVAILMGSENDWVTVETTIAELSQLGVAIEAKIMSAHRTPEATIAYIREADQRGCAVFIAAAGLAAHLGGCIAAHTLKPVIGIPMESGSLQGLDALLSTVQMPGGIPVACMGIGKPGAKNAAIFAAQILAIQDDVLRKKLSAQRESQKEKLKEADVALQSQLKTHGYIHH
ncbi:MAG: 5-(carboxyamino)imidazole ribonucleotide mutase [Gammaproteobacteria bacterium RIFCSPHIGHO2_12_FULL_41_15]|nr:MAG: 5-(carboxyamino)imidazole ribonucleotide mutase [Gammaproteobacteria bacterium RIFCSPHIGHO2_12_FULL_41_15]